jgi:hypothetical protein
MAIFARRAPAANGRGTRPRRAAPALAIAGVAGLSLLASACGGSPGASPGSSHAPGPGDGLAFSACMRSHGVPNFPDPGSDGSVPKPSKHDLNSPGSLAAFRACRSLASSGGSPPPPGQEAQLQRQVLAFAKCMRSHGVPEFPDLNLVSPHQYANPGHIDPNSPIVTAAVAACRSKLRAGGGLSAEELVQEAATLVQGAAGQGKSN